MPAIRPMKPPTARLQELSDIRFPVYACPKYNGIRNLNVFGVSQSASGKKLPNRKLQEFFNELCFHGMDGELINGSPTAYDVWNKTVSCVNTIDGELDGLTWYVFDVWNSYLSFKDRITQLTDRIGFVPPLRVVQVPYIMIHSVQQLEVYYTQTCLQGFEGVILRNPRMLYKQGRSTMNEQGMMRIKPLEHSEAVVLAMHELQHNDNPLEESELGFAKRSTHQDGMVGAGTCGALTVRDLKNPDWVFNLSGFTAELKAELWAGNPIGKVLTYAYFPVGLKDKPLQPRFQGWRPELDMTEY